MIEKEAKVSTEFEPNEPIGEHPYEIDWAKLQEPYSPPVTFSDLSGWRMQVQDAVAVLRPSRSQNIWDRPVGKLTYRGDGNPKSQPRILLSPPQPIRVPEGSDCAEMWIYGNRWDYLNPPDTPPVKIFLNFRDDRGRKQRINIDTIRWKNWWLLHRKLPVKTEGWSFVSLELEGGWQREDRTLFFDNITFYAESLRPLEFPSCPKRNLKLFEGQSLGLNTGSGRLEFPTREETILPVNLTEQFKTEVKRERNLYIFRYSGCDCDIVYQFDPAQGLSGIESSVNEKHLGQLMAGGGVKLSDKKTEGDLLQAELNDGVVTASYERGVIYRLRLWQKSLVIDATRKNEGRQQIDEAVELSFGEIRGLHEPRTVYVPFITYGHLPAPGSNPVVLMGRAAGDEHSFISVWLDWYRSNGSEPYAFPEGEATATGVRINGGVRYHPKTDGKRNDLSERVFVTVSPVFEEVLPVIPNPVGLHAHLAVDRLWQDSGGPGNYEEEMEYGRKLCAYGIDKIITFAHRRLYEISHKIGESFSLRQEAAPGKVSNETLKKYLDHQKSLGWFAGLYTVYTGFEPINEYWNPDYAIRKSDGDWISGWPLSWNLKPAAAVMFENKMAPIIQRKFHPGCKQVSDYTDVHTAAAPWRCLDYDARVPGAGTFAQTFYCYGEVVRNDSRIYSGPIFSEGTFQWLYAGLADGNYASIYNNRHIANDPLLPVFYLREIHTKECGIGISWVEYFLRGIPDWKKDLEGAIDRFILHIIAYGTIGWLLGKRVGPGDFPEEEKIFAGSVELTCRSYYMLQRLQARYGLLSPAEIAYWDGAKLVSVSEALVKDLPKTRRQLFISYPNGLKIWINDWNKQQKTEYKREAVWKVVVDGVSYEIPPAGWLAVQGRSFLTFSALIDGHKVDFLKDTEEKSFMYVDGRGKLIRLDEVATKGAIAIRRIGKDQAEVLDISRAGKFGLNQPFGIKNLIVKCEVFNVKGKLLGEAEIQRKPDYTWIIGKPNGHKYIATLCGRSAS